MKTFGIALLIAIIGVVCSCKKSDNNNSKAINIAIADTILDAALDQDQLANLDTIADLQLTSKDIFLPDGENLYNYLSVNDPSLLSVSNPSQTKFTFQNKITNSANANTLQAASDEDERTFIFSQMFGLATKLTDKIKNAQNIPSQPLGLAYVYDDKDPTSPMVSAANGDGSPAKCQEKLYGLDCSGFMQLLMVRAGIGFVGNADAQAKVSNWNIALKKLGYPNLQMQRFDPDIRNVNLIKSGDIVFWYNKNNTYVDHIGIVFSDNQNQLDVFISNGAPSYTCEQNKAKGPTKNRLQSQLKDMIRPCGILRLSIPAVVYSYSTDLPNPYDYEYLAVTGLGQKLFFGVGNKISEYDTVRKTWINELLRENRYRLAAAAIGTKVIFAGGTSDVSSTGYSDAVDIYDTNSGWTHDQHLSLARSHLAAAAAGNKIVFAGGDSGNGYVATVDIYDVTKNQNKGGWDTPTTLQGGARRKFSGAATGNIIMFAGGEGVAIASKNVDVYDVVNNTWGLNSLITPTYGLNGTGAGNKILFSAGGQSNGPVMFDVSSVIFAATPINPPHPFTALATAGNFIVCGGAGTVDVYNTLTNTWQSLKVKTNLQYWVAASTDKTVMLAGEPISSNPTNIVSKVDIFTLVEK